MKCVRCHVNVRRYGVIVKGREMERVVCDPCVDKGYFAEYDEDDILEYRED